jgi:hypothetical protein
MSTHTCRQDVIEPLAAAIMLAINAIVDELDPTMQPPCIVGLVSLSSTLCTYLASGHLDDMDEQVVANARRVCEHPEMLSGHQSREEETGH